MRARMTEQLKQLERTKTNSSIRRTRSLLVNNEIALGFNFQQYLIGIENLKANRFS